MFYILINTIIEVKFVFFLNISFRLKTIVYLGKSFFFFFLFQYEKCHLYSFLYTLTSNGNIYSTRINLSLLFHFKDLSRELQKNARIFSNSTFQQHLNIEANISLAETWRLSEQISQGKKQKVKQLYHLQRTKMDLLLDFLLKWSPPYTLYGDQRNEDILGILNQFMKIRTLNKNKKRGIISNHESG